MALRLTKTLLVALAGVFALLVAYNNVVDYGSNFAFVQHVLSMDTTFPENALLGRAIHEPWFHHGAYVLIIATEFLVAAFCLFGAARLAVSIGDAGAFAAAKASAVYGLTLGLALWFGGFMIVGGEWFAMWQSDIWNGVPSAFRFAAVLGIILNYLTAAPDEA